MSFVKRFSTAMMDPKSWLYPAWLAVIVKYRNSYMGWLWMLAGPAVFIFVVGPLFVGLSKRDPNIFIPHMATGLIIFQYISNILSGATSLYRANKQLLLQGNRFDVLIPLIFIAKSAINFFTSSILIIVVLYIYDVPLTSRLIYLVPSLFLMLAHSFWVALVFGYLGARYRDFGEIISAVMRVAFLATPIIWMPSGGGRGGIIGSYINFNPIYHALEPIRSSILGTTPPEINWWASCLIAAIGIIVAIAAYGKFSRRVIMWV